MRILICDDEIQYVENLREHVTEYMQLHMLPCTITTTISPIDILNRDFYYDLAFLDIQMDELDGISLAKKLKEANEKIAIFFVTNYEEYQDDAMDLRAFRFFPKPFDVKRLYSGLDKAMEYIDGAHVDIFVCENNCHQQILIDDILYVTRLNRRVFVKTQSNSLSVRDSYDMLCKKMPVSFFYPVHKSFMVNLHYVKKYNYSDLLLTDGSQIPIASRKQAEFHKYWFEYLRRR